MHSSRTRSNMHSSHKIVLLLLLHIIEYPIPPSSSVSKPLSVSSNTTNSLETNLTSAKFGFLVDLRVGSQCFKQYLIMDTGSSLLWINCHPCVLDAPEPLFDPKSSTSFEKENCVNTEICHGTGAVRLGSCRKGRCSYEVLYGSSFSKGYLGRDTFRLGTSPKALKDIVFGCCRNAKQTRKSTGVLGLGANRLSLVSQTNASKFSYCLGNISDESYPYSFLTIGDDIGVFRYTTRLIIKNQYFINLESIRVGKKLLDVDPHILRRNSTDYTGGMVVDTGSTYTFIPNVVFEKFQDEVINLVHSTVPRNYSITYEDDYTMLCYNGVLTRDLQGFPTVQFTFEGEATMEFTMENIFYQLYADSFCLSILPSEVVRRGLTVSILGNVMQQFFYIGIDLEAKKFKFRNTDCPVVKSPRLL